MDSREIVSWFLKVFKYNGLWPPKNFSLIYTIWSFVVFSLLFILHLLFKICSVFFVKTVDEMVGILLISSAVLTIVAKACILRFDKDTFINLLNLMQDIDKKIQISEYNKYLDPLVKRSRFIFKLFIGVTMWNWSCLVIQVIISPPQEKMYLSTLLYPYEILKQPAVYIAGLFYEAIANLFIVPVFVALDLYVVMLLFVLISYINILCERLRVFGNEINSQHSKLKLVEICDLYVGILR